MKIELGECLEGISTSNCEPAISMVQGYANEESGVLDC